MRRPGGSRPRRPTRAPPPSSVLRQRDAALQKRGGGCNPTSSSGAAGRLLEFCGDVLVVAMCRARPMPRAPVRIRLRVSGHGKDVVHAAPVTRSREAVCGGPDQRMRELDACGDPEQARVYCCVRRTRVEPEGLRGATKQRRVAERLRRGDENEELSIARKPNETL